MGHLRLSKGGGVVHSHCGKNGGAHILHTRVSNEEVVSIVRAMVRIGYIEYLGTCMLQKSYRKIQVLFAD